MKVLQIVYFKLVLSCFQSSSIQFFNFPVLFIYIFLLILIKYTRTSGNINYSANLTDFRI
jgi:hypothetical protein